MPTPLTLTLLILLAAVIAAAAIFFLLARSRPTPTPPHASPGPTLTLIAETITDAATGQPLTPDVYLNPTGGLSLGTALPRSGALLYEKVTRFDVTLPLDGSAETRVAAPGCRPWAVVPLNIKQIVRVKKNL